MAQKNDWAALVQERVLSLLESGTLPWQQPWVGGGVPTSLATGKPYAGASNRVFLNAVAWQQNYTSRFWLTYQRAQDLGGHVRKGEHGWPVVYLSTRTIECETPDGQTETVAYPIVGGRYVFNLDQTEGVTVPEDMLPASTAAVIQPFDQCWTVFTKLPERPRIQFNGAEAFYAPLSTPDYINLPTPQLFTTPDDLWKVAWHEIGHWAVERQSKDKPFTSATETYSFEELIAESVAAMLALECGIDPRLENTAAYVQGWLKPLQDNKRWYVQAMSEASRVVDWLLNRQPTEEAA